MTIQKLKEYQVKVLGHRPNEFTEYRKIGEGYFVGINPRKTKEGRTAQDVTRISCIVIDIDYIPSQTLCNNLFEAAKTIIAGEQYHSYVIVSSGRGIHIYVPVDLPKGADIKGYISHLSETYVFSYCHIDKSVSDDARIIRVWGSINEKSGSICQPLEEHFQGINNFKLPIFKQKEEVKVLQNAIPNGSRNATLTQLAGSMRRKGFTKEAIEAALLAENQEKCSPPLQEAEVKSIATSISRYEPSKQLTNSSSKSFMTDMDSYAKDLDNRKIGYLTGFTKLDEMLAGLQKGKLYVIAARTNEGKTSFAMQIANNLIAQRVSVLYFPTELGYAPLFDKIVAQNAGISLRQFQTGNFKEDEKQKIKETIEAIRRLPFNVHEDFALTLETVQNKSKEICPAVLIIDYLQAFKFKTSDTGQQAGEIAEIMRGLKQLNEELNIPILVCCQFSRAAINSELSLAHLKGSGSIEEFSDVVLALSTLSKYEYPRPVDLYILKSRYSEIGRIRMDFFSTIGKFVEHDIKEKTNDPNGMGSTQRTSGGT